MVAEIIAAIDWNWLGYLKDVWFIFLVLVGFSVIIFVHELGHFLMAKWVGIRVDTFAIGFGPRLFGFKKGGTDYCLRLLPLGGYVKMLGQEDFAMDQDRVDATRIDPASFLAKTPAQRALVVSGGVVMNVIFAALAFIVVFMHGLEFGAPIAGAVMPNSPAADAGIQPGDQFQTINGESILHFQELHVAVATSDPATGVDMGLLRNGKPIHINVKPLKNAKADLLQIGIAGAGSVTIDEGLEGMPDPEGRNLQAGDRIVRVGGITPEYYHQIQQVIVEAAGKPVNLVVERKVREGDKEKTVQVTVPKRAYLILLTNEPPTPSGTTMPAGKDLVDISQENASLLGLEPRRKFVLTPEVPDESIPDKTQYVQAGDVVVKVDGIADPTWNEINDYLAEHKRETTELDVLRDGKARKVKLYVPWQKNYFELLLALGFDDLNPIVADVIENTPAAKLKLPRGARIIACGDKKVATWFDLVDGMKTRAGKDFTIAFEHGGKMQSGALSVPKNWRWEDNVSYAIDFYTQPMMVMIKGQTPQEAIALGIRQTWNMIKMVYVTIQRVAFTQTIGVKQLSGPIFIIHMGKRALAGGFNKLLYYLALISANLAVINFLPIPVVDGGLILVLLLEKLRGRPMSPRSTAIWQATGLALIIGLFVLVTYNDILRLIRGGQ